MKFRLVLISLLSVFTLVLPIVFTVIPVSPALAATPIYVNAATGNDSYDGTSPTFVSGTVGPKLTIQAGINVVDVGGTVNIAAGDYNQALTVNKSLTIMGAGPSATIIRRSVGSPVMTITANNVSIRDLTITDSIKLVEGIRVSINSGVTSGLTVENVDFTNISSGVLNVNAEGINIYNDTSPTAPMSFSGLTVRNCRFRGINITDPSRNIGILAYPYLNLSNFYVDNCKFSNLMTGLYIGRSSIDGLTFVNNEFGPIEQANYTGAPGGIYIGDSGSLLPTTYQNITVTGNTFHDYGRGVSIWNYANGRNIGRVDITGNTFTNSIASAGVMITARWNAGNVSTLEGPITISNNTFSENQTILAGAAMIDIRAGLESPSSQINVTGNTITFNIPTYGAAKYGMKFRGPFTNVNINGNTLDGNLAGGTSANMPPTSGIVFGTNDSTYGPMSGNAVINVTGNSIREFAHGVAIYDYTINSYGNLPAGADLNINYDSIICNSEYGVITGPGQVINAVNTWWGCNNGPGGVGPGSGEEVSDNVTYSPWLTLNLLPDPLNVVEGGSATITADMTRNSAGASAGGYVPDGTLISFTATGGTFSPTTKTTTNGIANSVFTAGAIPGLFSVTAQAPTCYKCSSAKIMVNLTTEPVEYIGTKSQTTSHGAGGGFTAPATRPFLPVELPNLSVQSASLSAKTVTPGTPVTVTADITNKSAVNGNKKVTLYVNGQVETTQGITVNSGSSSQLTFNVSRSEPGDYNVYVDGVPAGSFKVELFSASDAILIISVALVALAFLIGMVLLWRRQRAG